MPDGSIPGFEASTFTHDGISRQLFRAGTGPAVVVIHEVPGLHPEAIAFGRRVLDAGFTVYMPALFGVPGKPFGCAYTMRSIAGACVARAFVTMATDRPTPTIRWLRRLAPDPHAHRGGPGGGAAALGFSG